MPKKKRAVAYNAQKNQYVRVCGCHKTPDGKRKPTKFWLGADLPAAEKKIDEITAAWQKLVLNGLDCWTAEAMYALEAKGLVKTANRRLQRSEISINLNAVKKSEDVAPFLNEYGAIKAEYVQKFYRYVMDKMLSQDAAVQRMIEAVIEQYWIDPITTIERIAKIGIAPEKFAQLINGDAYNFGNVIAIDDSSERAKVLQVIEGKYADATTPTATTEPKDNQHDTKDTTSDLA